MRYAIISDIHSNHDALSKVMERIADAGIEKIVCLGDIIGYGPEPRKCLEVVIEHCQTVVKGNHDEAVLLDPFGFNPYARKAIKWSKKELEPSQNPGDKRVEELWEWLQNMNVTIEWENPDTMFLHGSPRDPISEYILEKDLKEPVGPNAKLDQIFEKFKYMLFVGHSHVPGVFMANRKYVTPIPEEPFRVTEQCVINVGSVGQPRDYDNRACWVEVNDDRVTHHRVPYDFHTTYEKVEATNFLHISLGARIKIGV